MNEIWSKQPGFSDMMGQVHDIFSQIYKYFLPNIMQYLTNSLDSFKNFVTTNLRIFDPKMTKYLHRESTFLVSPKIRRFVATENSLKLSDEFVICFDFFKCSNNLFVT